MYTSRADLYTFIKRGNCEAESAHANMKLTLAIKKKDFYKKYLHQPLFLTSTKCVRVDSKNIKIII